MGAVDFDFSPVSEKGFFLILSSSVRIDGDKDRVNRLSKLIRIGGGYKVLARLKHSRSHNHERIYDMYTKPRPKSEFTFDIWLGRGYPFSPYLRGFIINFFLKEMKPRELKVAPDELFPTEGVKDEWGLLRNFFKDLCVMVLVCGEFTIHQMCGDFFKAPFF